VDEDYSNEELIQYSLFPRINPPDFLCKPGDIILKPQAVVHPNFIPFKKKVYLGFGRDLESRLEELYSSMPKRERMSVSKSSIDALRAKYYEISDRSSRIHFLHKMLQQKSDVSCVIMIEARKCQ
jgi:hypothetical protein